MTTTLTSHRIAAVSSTETEPYRPARSGFPVAGSITKLNENEVDALWAKYVSIRGESRRAESLGPEADGLRNALVEHYLHLVKYTADRLHTRLPSQVDLDELKQSGVFGLIDAVNGYDPSRGVRFEAYAKQRIHGAILDDLRNMDYAPRLVRTHGHQAAAATRQLEIELGRPPSSAEIAVRLGIAVDEYDLWMMETQRASMTSLDKPANESDAGGNKEMTRGDLVEDNRTADPLTVLQKKEMVALATRGLSRKEKLIVVLYYLEELTMKEIGLVLDLSESRVCQIHNRIIDQLKNQLDTLRDDLLAD